MLKPLLTTCFTIVYSIIYCSNISTSHLDNNSTRIVFELGEYSIQTGDNFNIINSSAQLHTLDAGAPLLPRFVYRILVNEDSPNYEITNVDSVVYNDISIDTFEGMRKGNDSVPVAININTVVINGFYPSSVLKSNPSYHFRDEQAQSIEIFPFKYNPSTNDLIVYTSIEIIANGITINNNDDIISSQFINKSINTPKGKNQQKRYSPISDEGELLIVSHPTFVDILQPFAEWKTQKGIKTTIVESTLFNNQLALKSYIDDFYHEHNLKYLLLVGDNAQIEPFERSYGYSDVAYGYIEGDDYYPEIFIGRFSGNSISEIETQIQRSIQYDKYPTISSDWANKATLVASDENDGGLYDFEHMQNIKTLLLNTSYSDVDELYDGSRGGNDAPNNPTSAMLQESLNTGRGLFMYLGHAQNNQFTTTGFSTNDLINLNQQSSLPLALIGGCQAGNFVNQNCIAEQFLTSTSDNSPIGTVAMLAASEDQYWNPPPSALHEFAIMVTDPENTVTSVGGLIANSCMIMNDYYLEYGYETTDAWILFGDPSLTFHNNQILPIIASCPDSLTIGNYEFSLNNSAQNSTLTLIQNNTVIHKQLLSEGDNTISFSPILTSADIIVTISAPNSYTFQDTIGVRPTSSSFITATNITVSSDTISIRDTVYFSFTLQNNGFLQSDSLLLEIRNASGNIQPFQTYMNAPIDAGSEMILQDILPIKALTSISGTRTETVYLYITDIESNEQWRYSTEITIIPPLFSIYQIHISPINASNFNTITESGELYNLSFNLINNSDIDFTNIAFSIITVNDVLILSTIPQASEWNSEDTISLNTDVFIPLSINPGRGFEIYTIINSESRIDTISQWIILERQYESFSGNNINYDLWDYNSFQWHTFSPGYEDDYCVQSAPIREDDTSSFSINLEIEFDDSISFYLQTSCEWPDESDGLIFLYDYLSFSMDGLSMGQWYGETPWQKATFPVKKGSHVLSWSYIKDESVSEGFDCAWVDSIVLPNYNSDFVSNEFYFTSTPPTEAYIDNMFSYVATTNITSEISAHTLPNWCTLSTNEYGADIQGSPSFLTDDNQFIIIAKHDNQITTQEFLVDIHPNETIDIIENSSKEIKIYPIPSKGEINIEWNNIEIYSMEIIDATGKITKYFSTHGANKIENIQLQTGLYAVLLKGVSEIFSQSIIVE